MQSVNAFFQFNSLAAMNRGDVFEKRVVLLLLEQGSGSVVAVDTEISSCFLGGVLKGSNRDVSEREACLNTETAEDETQRRGLTQHQTQ